MRYFLHVDAEDIASQSDETDDITIDYAPALPRPSQHHGTPPPHPSNNSS